MAKQKVFITGGAGFLGINLVRYLLDRDYDIVTYDIAPFDYTDCATDIHSITGDIRNFTFLKKAMKGCDLVVHTAAALPLYSKKDIFSTDIVGTRNVLQAAQENNIKRVIHISSTAVYGVPDHHPLYESDKLVGVGAYGEAKVRAEQVCLDFREKGMCVPILRPKSFIGPERLGVFAIYYDWARSGKGFPLLGNGRNRYQLLDVDDLCEAIYLCMNKPKPVANDTFNIGAKEFSTMKSDFGIVLKKAGFGKKILCVPAKPLILVLRFFELLGISPLYKWVYETAPKDSFVSVEKAEKKLGFIPKYSNKQALLRNYEWYLEHYKKYAKRSGVTHRVPWKQGILRFFKMFF